VATDTLSECVLLSCPQCMCWTRVSAPLILTSAAGLEMVLLLWVLPLRMTTVMAHMCLVSHVWLTATVSDQQLRCRAAMHWVSARFILSL
jgi:hypothetical protein